MAAPSSLTRLARRGVVAVSGPQAGLLLDRVLTRHATDVAADAPVNCALLTPQGKILHELWIHREGEEGFALDLPRDGVEALVKQLTLFRLRAKAEIADVSAARAVLVGAGGVRTLGDPDADASTDTSAYDAWRVRDGRPEQGIDYGSADVYPADVNLDILGGVDFAKGCFPGQEVVSRMKRRGIIRKRTLLFFVEGGAPAKGAEIEADGVVLGTAMSSADGCTLGLARLDRLAAADPALIRVDARPARFDFPEWFPWQARVLEGVGPP
jgi:folate-binding protein YgfZ